MVPKQQYRFFQIVLLFRSAAFLGASICAGNSSCKSKAELGLEKKASLLD